jgi:phosphoadenosine phosphosulfate reductase
MSILLDPPGAFGTLREAPVALRRRPALSPADVAAADRSLADATPFEIVRWALDTFGRRMVLTASFADTTLIDIATRVDPDIEVVFLDTGFHFAETLNAVRRAMERYALNLTVLRPDPDAADLWAAGTKACCDARKVQPLDRYLAGHADAWLSGLRRADDPGRADAPIVSIDKRGLVKVNPIATMSDEEYERYIAERDVLVNTLQFDGYASI